jgi:heme exporter protein B
MGDFLQTMVTILWKDFRAELRSRELIGSMGLFTLLGILVFSFALELDRSTRQEVVNGVLWVTMVFASILGLNRSMAQEREQGNMDALMIAPVARSAIFMGKFLGNLGFTLLIGLVLLPVMSVLYNLNLFRPELIVMLCLGVTGISAIGTLLATMTVQTRARETLLPIALLPTVLPIIVTVVRATNALLLGDDIRHWLIVLALVDVIYIVIGVVLFEYTTED